jgi:photosystem II stability/assembly factor-like uncharacterized protein
VSDRVAWASGNNGVWLKTTDGGTWRASKVDGAEALDFRDVEAFDERNAHLLSIGEGDRSRIYRTTNGGETWSLQFTNQDPKAFFDAMAFWDRGNGIAVSDPVEGRFVIIRTSDGGATWQPVTRAPAALSGEAAFAASGTCITVQGKTNAWIGTGGARARVLRSTDRGETWAAAEVPLLNGEPSAGVFSLAFRDSMRGVIVGGDYRKEGEARHNIALTSDGGRTWKSIQEKAPSGFRSCVAFVAGESVEHLVTVGPSGADYSPDGGATWTSFGGTEGYHAVAFSRSGTAGWAVGEAGRVAKFTRK